MSSIATVLRSGFIEGIFEKNKTKKLILYFSLPVPDSCVYVSGRLLKSDASD